MAPITLFFGANSSGKSSIGQFLMMLKQTTESQDRRAVFYPGGKNSAVQLGSFGEMVYHRNLENEISFEYEWSPPHIFEFKDTSSQTYYSADTISFEATVRSDKESGDLSVQNLNYGLKEGINSILQIGMVPSSENSGPYKVTTENYSLAPQKGRLWDLGHPIRFYGFPGDAVGYYVNSEFVRDLNYAQEQFFKSIFYLEPLRAKTERLYSWSGIAPESVGYSGENTIAALLAARGRSISRQKHAHSYPFEEIIASHLKSMGLIDDFRVNKISPNRQEYEVNIKTKGSQDWVDLPDVGFGISQVLPVLVQCFYAPPGSIIIMEQPEIHLHPKAQSVLADVMIEVIHSRENGKDRNIQLIIETHSEHFLRRLQRRIAEDILSQDEVSVYFANITQSPATLEPLQIDDCGSIRNWPENFFGDEMEDITVQAKEAMKKRMRRANPPEN